MYLEPLFEAGQAERPRSLYSGDRFIHTSLGDIQDLLIWEPDLFDPERLFREHDDPASIRGTLKVTANLTLECYVEHESGTIVHDEARVAQIAALVRQVSVYPARNAFLAHIALQAASILIGYQQTQGAEVLIERLCTSLEASSSRVTTEASVLSPRSDGLSTHEAVEVLARALLIGHEFQHLLFHAEPQGDFELADRLQEELRCDDAGLELALELHERLEPGIGNALVNFEYAACALFFGNALSSRIRERLFGKVPGLGAFIAAKQRYDRAVTHFRRHSDQGEEYWPYRPAKPFDIDAYFDRLLAEIDALPDDPHERQRISDAKEAQERFNKLEAGPYAPHVDELQRCFLEVDRLLGDTFERYPEAFADWDRSKSLVDEFERIAKALEKRLAEHELRGLSGGLLDTWIFMPLDDRERPLEPTLLPDANKNDGAREPRIGPPAGTMLRQFTKKARRARLQRRPSAAKHHKT